MKRILPECFSFADREVLKFSAILLLFPYLTFSQSIEAKKLFNYFIRFESQVQKMFRSLLGELLDRRVHLPIFHFRWIFYESRMHIQMSSGIFAR